MGARIVERVQECTHLIAMKVTRTEKMLMAINTARNVVHFDWLVRSAAKGEFLGKKNGRIN